MESPKHGYDREEGQCPECGMYLKPKQNHQH